MNKLEYTISIRNKPKDIHIGQFIKKFYGFLALDDIKSVYGFVRYTPFYGGRSFTEQQISRRDVFWLYEHGIGLRLPVSNHNFTEEAFISQRQFFSDFNRLGNTVICTNDLLAMAIKSEFYNYSVEASAIKHINTIDLIEQNLKLYDSVVLPMECNDNMELLQSIIMYDRIILFGNARCAYNCPNKLCYKTISDSIFNQTNSSGIICSKQIIDRPDLGYIAFDLDLLNKLGFYKFKLIKPI